MSKGKIVLIAAGALLTVGAVAAISAPGERGDRGDRQMMGEDHHHEGFKGRMGRWLGKSMTRDEYDTNTRARFARLDKNGDGFIDAAEIEASITQRMEKRHSRMHGRMGERLMRAFDADRDGKVTKDEFMASVRKRFAQLDLNNDGKITDEDLPPMMRGRGVLTSDHRGRGMRMLSVLRDVKADKDGAITLDAVLAAANARFARFDKNNDGVIDSADVDALRKETVDYRVKRFIHAYAADSAGKVSKDQFFAKAGERFARLDRNNDGTISRGERSGRHHMGREGRGWWHRHGGGEGRGGDVTPAPERGDGTQSK